MYAGFRLHVISRITAQYGSGVCSIAAGCKGKQKRGKCGGDHEYGKCEVGTQPKCANCGGAHSVACGGCEERKKAVEVRKLRVSNGLFFAEAVK